MLHKDITTGGIHYIQNWSVADNTARDALTVAAADVGKVCQVTGTSSYYILTDDTPMTWQLIGNGAGTVTSVTSANSDATVATTTTTPVITIVQTPALRSATTTVNVSSATAPTSGQVLTATSGTAATWQTPSTGGGITLGTPVTLSTQTSVDYTGIPTGTKKIVFSCSALSTNGTSTPILQIGDSGGFETTGYSGCTTNLNDSASIGGVNSTDGAALVAGTTAATLVQHGSITLTLINSTTNLWAFTGILGRSDGKHMMIVGCSKALSGELTQIRLTTSGGTDVFDAGTVNIQYQ